MKRRSDKADGHEQRSLFSLLDWQRPAPLPYAANSATSKAAAESARHNAPTQRERVFRFITERGPYGATDAEGATALGMPTQSYTPRRGELVQAEVIRDSGDRRLTPYKKPATVWIATGKPLPEEER